MLMVGYLQEVIMFAATLKRLGDFNQAFQKSQVRALKAEMMGAGTLYKRVSYSSLLLFKPL